MKQCKKCGKVKVLEEFYFRDKAKGTRTAQCKSCTRERQNQNRNEEVRRVWYANNKVKMELYAKDYRAKNKEKLKQERERYRGTLNGRYSEYKGSAKSRDIKFDLTKEGFSSFWRKPCTYCGDEIETIGLDRIDPEGAYSKNNLVACCGTCNVMKMDKTFEEFRNHIIKIYDNLAGKDIDNV